MHICTNKEMLTVPWSTFSSIREYLFYWWFLERKSKLLPLKTILGIIYCCLCTGRCSSYFEGSTKPNSSIFHHFLQITQEISVAKKLHIFHHASSPHPKPYNFVSLCCTTFSYSHNFIVNAHGASKGNPRTFVGVVIICTSQEEFIDGFSMFLGTFSSNGLTEASKTSSWQKIGGYAGPLVFSYSNRLYHSCFMYY